MNKHTAPAALAGALLLALGAPTLARPELLVNGGFESGFTNWTITDQVGGDGAFAPQTGGLSPVNGLSVPVPPEGSLAAMTDSQGPGSHALYQDVLIPAGVTQATLVFSLYIKNTADAFRTPANLDWFNPALNQQARVDLMSPSADPFSAASVDIIQNLFQTAVGSPLVTGYNAFNIDVTAALTAHAGETIRLRFAEVDNVNIFNFGVDAVSLNIIPSPSMLGLACATGLIAARSRRPRS